MDYRSQTIDAFLLEDLSEILRLAIREDLDRSVDLTTMAIVPPGVNGSAALISRSHGVAASLSVLTGDARDLLTCERTILNVICRLSGIASLTKRYVDAVKGTKARVYDTRKTTPGWRRLEKYAVRCGGGHNHRLGLYDGILIKDNHLACRAAANGELLDAGQAVAHAKAFIESGVVKFQQPPMIEVEIDRISQLESALASCPNIILLDNMNCDLLRQCVAIRDQSAPNVELEASGGVNLSTIGNIAATGVDRISVGALTHSAPVHDIGLDWKI